ncbi:MAG: laccase domain-containing protein [Bradymonadales bacterium]|nr:MAG: laccase domain-containing protein [Bradymonadales bacterium]
MAPDLDLRIDLPTGFQANGAFLLSDAGRFKTPGAIKWNGQPLSLLEQVHEAEGLEITEDLDLSQRPRADFQWTRLRSVFLGIFVADCTAILIRAQSPGGPIVLAIHAGWRGTAAGVIDKALDQTGCRSGQAWLSPGISQAQYEVGEDVREAFPPEAHSFFEPLRSTKFLFDLKAYQAQLLQKRGFEVYSHPLCTWQQPELYSYRQSGAELQKRHLALIHLGSGDGSARLASGDRCGTDRGVWHEF